MDGGTAGTAFLSLGTMQESLLEQGGGAGIAPVPVVAAVQLPGFRAHCWTLFCKNWKLKRLQWNGLCCLRCCFSACPVPLPCAGCCELIFPLLILLPLLFAKYKCGETCVIFNVGGWGGHIPSAVGVQEGATACHDATHVPGASDSSLSDTQMSCNAWTDSLLQAGSFTNVMNCLAVADLRLALVTENPADRPKLDKMIHWIDSKWYPGLDLPANLTTEDGAQVTPCYSGICQNLQDVVGYERSERCNNGGCGGCCPKRLPSFSELQMPTLKTENDLNDYLKNWDTASAEPGGLIWGAVIFHTLGSDGSAGGSGDWSYSIRLNATDTVPTSGATTSIFKSRAYSPETAQYDSSGFSALQLLIDRYIVNDEVSEAKITDAAALKKNLEVNLRDDSGWNKWVNVTVPNPEQGYPDWVACPASGAWKRWLNNQDVLAKFSHYLALPLRAAPETVAAAALPVADQKIDGFYSIGLPVFGLFFILAFLYSMYLVVEWLIVEKETKVRESLKMMGVRTPALLVSFYGLQAAVFGLLTAVCAFFLTIFSPGDAAVLPNSSTILVWIFLFLWCMSFVSFAFAFHTLFSKAMTGGIVASVLMLAQYILYKVITIDPGSASEFVLASLCLLPNCALTLGVEIIGNYESLHLGATFGNLFFPYNNSSLGTVMLMLLLDCVLWTFLGWYLECVFPKEFGVVEKPWFVFQKHFWMGEPAPQPEEQQASSSILSRLSSVILGDTTDYNDSAAESDGSVEPPPRGLTSCIEIRRLRKSFPTPAGTKVAVSCLNLDIYEGQIFALLGHNGAGKTTTIHMLTGMLAPTAGDAKILGRSISTDMQTIRKTIGVCPQHDILWADLTVHNHLTIFAGLKGLDPTTCVASIIAEVGLTEKVATKSGELSGGMKRKLSLCMALIGDAKVVFLDEPTSGMDPFSRRSTWNMLQSNRAGRAMVLTTHFMDEADLLGDRIAILAEGELQCCGSSLFLKNRYGAGYRLVCSRQMEANCDAYAVEAVLQKHVEAAKLLTNVGAEMTYQLPTGAVRAFPKMLRELDVAKAQLGLQEYGLAQVTMEEVFLRVGQSTVAHESEEGNQTNGDEQQPQTEEGMLGHTMGGSNATPMSLSEMKPHQVFAVHLGALVVKRAQFGRRDYCSIICSVFLPALMLAGCLSLVNSQQDKPPTQLVLDASQFEQYGGIPPLLWSDSQESTPPFTDSMWGGFKLAPTEQDVPLPAPLYFFGRNYSHKNDAHQAGLPTYPSGEECPEEYPSGEECLDDTTKNMVPYDPDHTLSMMNIMWIHGQGVTPEHVSWGGVLLPAPTEAAHRPVTVLYNTSATHSFPTFTSAATNALRHHKGATGSIEVASHPLPMVGQELKNSSQLWALLITIMIIVTFAFVPAAIIAFPVMEAEAHHNSRHQQYISGVSIPAYWLANFIWDLALFMLLLLICGILLQAYDVASFVTSDCADLAGSGAAKPSPCEMLHLTDSPMHCDTDLHTLNSATPAGSPVSNICPVTCKACGTSPFIVTILLFAGYGFAIIPATYIVSFMFSKHTTAQMIALLANIMFGLMLVLTSYILRLINEDTRLWNSRLTPFFRMSPGFNLGNGTISPRDCNLLSV